MISIDHVLYTPLTLNNIILKYIDKNNTNNLKINIDLFERKYAKIKTRWNAIYIEVLQKKKKLCLKK